MNNSDPPRIQSSAFITNHIETTSISKRAQSLNRHKTPNHKAQSQVSFKKQSTVTSQRYCMAEDPSSNISNRIAFFNNPLNKTIKEKLNQSRGFDHNKDILNASDIYNFDLVVNDSNFDNLVYEKTLEKCINKVYNNNNLTAFVIGEQYTKKATYFFLKENSILKKILTSLKTKFALFNVSKTNNLKLDLKMSVFGIFNNCVYDFLGEESQRALDNIQLKKMKVLSNNQEKNVMEKIRGAFGISKTLAFTGKNGLVIFKIFVNIKDKITKQSFIKSEINLVVVNNVSAQLDNINMLKRMFIVGQANKMSETIENKKDSKLYGKSNTSLAGIKLLERVINSDYIRFYYTFNDLYKYRVVNEQLLEWYKQFDNEWKHMKNLYAQNNATMGKSAENMSFGTKHNNNTIEVPKEKSNDDYAFKNESILIADQYNYNLSDPRYLKHSITNNPSIDTKFSKLKQTIEKTVPEVKPLDKDKNIVYKSLKTMEDIVHNPVNFEQDKAQYMFDQLNDQINGLKNMLPFNDIMSIDKKLNDLNARFQE